MSATSLNIIEPGSSTEINVTEVGNEVTTNVITEDINVDVILSGGILQVSGDKNFVFTQSSASDTWTINHTLNKFPAVEVVDSANDIVIGNVTYNSTTQITITFTAAFSGKAYLN